MCVIVYGSVSSIEWRRGKEERPITKCKQFLMCSTIPTHKGIWPATGHVFILKILGEPGANELLNPFAIFVSLFFAGRSMGEERNLKWIEICELRHMLRVQLTWVTFSMLLNWVLNEAVLWLKQISLIFLPCTFKKQTTLSHIAVWVLTELRHAHPITISTLSKA